MAVTSYYDREGEKISLAAWKEKQADESYRQLKAYDNGTVRVTLEWTGRVKDAANSFQDMWPLFVLNVGNYGSDGVLRADPIEDGKTFGDEATALKTYTEFLTRWTESHVVENGTTGEMELVEEGNTLVPEAPPDPNRPTTMIDDDIGAW
jgi:hypothetical protein